MSRLIESIRLENGVFHRLQYHQARIDLALIELSMEKNTIRLQDHLLSLQFPSKGIYKCRVVYKQQIESVEFIPYRISVAQSLKVVHDQSISYKHKYEDRSAINILFEQRQLCDDVLIIKNGFVTDSSYSNIIFFDGEDWITPDTPLLKGTMREFLLGSGKIKQASITIQDISSFRSFRLINALLGFDGPEIDVSRIVL